MLLHIQNFEIVVYLYDAFFHFISIAMFQANRTIQYPPWKVTHT